MTGFEERERAFEAKFQLDNELAFKAAARRDRLLARWAAGVIGMPAPEAEAYARRLVDAMVDERLDDDGIVARIAADLAAAKAGIGRAAVAAELARLAEQAAREVTDGAGAA